jgi:hypothetical protein
MKELVLEFLETFWLLLSSISVYILAGFILFGIFKVFFPKKNKLKITSIPIQIFEEPYIKKNKIQQVIYYAFAQGLKKVSKLFLVFIIFTTLLIVSQSLNIFDNKIEIGFIKQISAVILLYLSIKYSFRNAVNNDNCNGCSKSCKI